MSADASIFSGITENIATVEQEQCITNKKRNIWRTKKSSFGNTNFDSSN